MANMLTIEVGTAEIRVAEMRDDKKGSSIRRCFRFAVPQGLVEDGLVRDAGGLGEQLKNELLSRKISARKVRFIVASSRIATREVRIPFIKKNRIQDLIETNATDYFPIDPAEYNISYRIIDIEGEGKEIPSDGVCLPERCCRVVRTACGSGRINVVLSCTYR